MNLNTQFPTVPVPNFPDAACAGFPTDMFFPTAGTDGREAKSICAGCRSKTPCLDWAIETREPFGVFGGMTAPERERLLHPGRPITTLQPRGDDDHRTELEAMLPCTARTAAQRAGIPLSAALRILIDIYDEQGLTASDIADRLNVAERTVVRYRAEKAAA